MSSTSLWPFVIDVLGFFASPLLIWALAYGGVLLTSGVVVRTLLSVAGQQAPEGAEGPGFVIGKIEDVLVITFVLLGEFTALALVFAAKSIVRRDPETEHASYYVLGTLANFTWALVVGVAARVYLGAV